MTNEKTTQELGLTRQTGTRSGSVKRCRKWSGATRILRPGSGRWRAACGVVGGVVAVIVRVLGGGVRGVATRSPCRTPAPGQVTLSSMARLQSTGGCAR